MAARKQRFWKSLRMHEGRIVSDRDKSPWTIKEWREVPAPVRECGGLNCCESIIDAMRYVNMEVLAEVEIDGVRIDGDDKITVQRMRIIKAWRWTREDSIALTVFGIKLYLECLEKEAVLDKAHTKKQIESARMFIENPTYENMLAASTALFGGFWADASNAGAFLWYLGTAASAVHSSIGARVAFSKIRADFFKRSHQWIVKRTKDMEALQCT